MKKAIIFDLDGTLINSLPDISASMNRSLQKFGLPEWPEEDYRLKVGNGVFKLAERSVGERTDLADAVCKIYMEDYAKNCMVHTYAYQGVPEMLKKIHALGLKTGVLSNKDQVDVENVLAFCFPEFSFDACRGRVENVPLKPDPTGALLMAEQFCLHPEEIWYVGDTMMDMRCGNAAGMETIGLLWGYRSKEELIQNGAAHLAATPEEVVQLLER